MVKTYMNKLPKMEKNGQKLEKNGQKMDKYSNGK